MSEIWIPSRDALLVRGGREREVQRVCCVFADLVLVVSTAPPRKTTLFFNEHTSPAEPKTSSSRNWPRARASIVDEVFGLCMEVLKTGSL